MKTNNLFSICSLGIVIYSLLSVPIFAENATETYPVEYTHQYLNDCLKTSTAEGLAKPEAEKLCNCTLTEFQQQYTLEAFKELNSKAETDEDAASQLIEVGQFCFESLLYE